MGHPPLRGINCFGSYRSGTISLRCGQVRGNRRTEGRATRQSNPTGYTKAIEQINKELNSGDSLGGTDPAFNKVLDKVRASLGRDIDFSNQSDREAIGNALIDQIRQNPNCNVVGSTIVSCGP